MGRSGKEDDVETRLEKGFQSVVEVEKGDAPEQKCQQENQVAGLLSDGDVCASLWSRDMGSDKTGA